MTIVTPLNQLEGQDDHSTAQYVHTNLNPVIDSSKFALEVRTCSPQCLAYMRILIVLRFHVHRQPIWFRSTKKESKPQPNTYVSCPTQALAWLLSRVLAKISDQQKAKVRVVYPAHLAHSPTTPLPA